MFTTLVMVMGPRVCTYIQIHPIVHVKDMQLWYLKKLINHTSIKLVSHIYIYKKK